MIHAPESLRVTPGKARTAERLLQGSPGRYAADAQAAQVRGPAGPLLRVHPGAGRAAAGRRAAKPQVTICQLLVGRIEEGVIKYQATFSYTILYSGVKSLRIDVPADVAATAREHDARACARRRSTRRPPTWPRAARPGA